MTEWMNSFNEDAFRNAQIAYETAPNDEETVVDDCEEEWTEDWEEYNREKDEELRAMGYVVP